MVGFSPQLATAAWAGFASNSSRGIQDMYINGTYYEAIYGGDFAAPMWSEYMQNATSGMERIDIPEVFIGNRPVTPAPKQATAPAAGNTNTAGNGNANQNNTTDQGNNNG